MDNAVLMLWVLFCLPIMGGASISLLSPKGVNYEVAALMAMKNKMNDESNVLDGWDINSVDPCTWNMVGCTPEGFVISLSMSSVGLSGTLSPSIGNLSHLRSLWLQNNQLSGPIPVEIGKLSALQTLDLSDNQFIGEIPSSLGLLTHLNYLRLSRNKLSGQIPGLVANLTGLSFLDLSFNNLSGPTPNILAKDYSITGNNFLCTSSSAQTCMRVAKPINGTSSSEKVSGHHRWVVSVAIGVSCTFLVSMTLLVCLVHWCRSRLLFTSYVQQDYEFDIGHLKRFSFRELQIATSNFSPKNILGQGGFGVVYKGYLPNRTIVAVKRLKDPNFTGEVQFQTEVEMIGLALHRNLLRLYGFCMTSDERLLVYPYMPNGSVADRLRDTGQEKPSLDWNRRMHIALGAARGLLYLHEQCNPKIIHRDVKAANILLDENFESVVGDFGLAKLLDRRDSHVTTAVRGTVGHIAPEYLSTGQSSEKTDVFLQLEYQHEKFSTYPTCKRQNKLPESDSKPFDKEHNSTSANCTDPQVESRTFENPNGLSDVSQIKDKGSCETTELPPLDLSLKRLRGAGDVGACVHDDRSILRHSDLSAFSKYNTASSANQAPTGNVGSCSPLDNSSVAMKTETMHNFPSHVDGIPPNQQSNGSSNNIDMVSTTKYAIPKSEAYNEKSESTSAFKCFHSSAFQPVTSGRMFPPQKVSSGKADDVVVDAVQAQVIGSHQQVQVQHHHHHYHHYHHHVHSMQEQQQTDNDDLFLKNMAAAAPQCGSSNVIGGPTEGNAGNYSVNGSASGSNHGSNGQNGSTTALNVGATNMEGDNGAAGNSGAGAISGKGGGNRVEEDRFAQREAALTKFRQKRKERCFEKKVRYQSRKKLAEQRPRIRGQFVRQNVSDNKAGKDGQSDDPSSANNSCDGGIR